MSERHDNELSFPCYLHLFWQKQVLRLFGAISGLLCCISVLFGDFLYAKIPHLMILWLILVNFKIYEDFLFTCYHVIEIFFLTLHANNLCFLRLVVVVNPFAFCIKEQHIKIVETD